jgi:hypothetical protein
MRACALFLLWATMAIALPAQTFKSLHSFDEPDGAAPPCWVGPSHQWELLWDYGF